MKTFLWLILATILFSCNASNQQANNYCLVEDLCYDEPATYSSDQPRETNLVICFEDGRKGILYTDIYSYNYTSGDIICVEEYIDYSPSLSQNSFISISEDFCDTTISWGLYSYSKFSVVSVE
jgi:hypothetical protein